MNYFKYFIKNYMRILKQFLNELGILIWNTFDFILPELIIFAPIRSFVFGIFWKKGKNLYLRRENRFLYIGNLKLGDNCRINKGNLFENGNLTIVGNGCRIGYRNILLNTGHFEKDKQTRDKNAYSKPIKIGNNVWITSNCTILPETIIEDNVILSAGSVAKGRLESGWVYCGNPAIKVRRTEGILRWKI